MTPANEFPGNIIYYLLFLGFLGFFAYSAYTRFGWVTRGKWINRFDRLVDRLAGLVPLLLGNSRVVRPNYWYSGLLHTLIWWGFIVLQVRTLNFLLNGFDHSISLEHILGDVYNYALRPMMDVFNILVILGVAMAAYQRLFWRPKPLTLNSDAWIILGLIFFLMVTDVFTNSFEIYLFPRAHPGLSFLA